MSKASNFMKQVLRYADIFSIKFLYLYSPKKFDNSHYAWGLVSALIFVACCAYSVFIFMQKEEGHINYEQILADKCLEAHIDGNTPIGFTVNYYDYDLSRIYMTNKQFSPYLNVSIEKGDKNYSLVRYFEHYYWGTPVE